MADARTFLQRIGRTRILTDAQANDLRTCLELAEKPALPGQITPDDYRVIGSCANIVSTISAVYEKNASNLNKTKAIQEIEKNAEDHHQAFRTFWIQAAQLILLNLLLPVLTALMGYIFGSQGSRQS